MAQVDHVDWPSKLIYLHADTVISGYDPIATYFEINHLVSLNANDEQGFKAAMEALGNEPKGGGGFTPAYGYLYSGWRIVPSNQSDHVLNLLAETISEDELSDRDVFDRSGLVNKVDIDSVYSPVEVRVVDGNGNAVALSDEDIARIAAAAGGEKCLPVLHVTLDEDDVLQASVEPELMAEITTENWDAIFSDGMALTHYNDDLKGTLCR